MYTYIYIYLKYVQKLHLSSDMSFFVYDYFGLIWHVFEFLICELLDLWILFGLVCCLILYLSGLFSSMIWNDLVFLGYWFFGKSGLLWTYFFICFCKVFECFGRVWNVLGCVLNGSLIYENVSNLISMTLCIIFPFP